MGIENSEHTPPPIQQPAEGDIDRWADEYRDKPELLETDEEHMQRVWNVAPGRKSDSELQPKLTSKADIEEADEAEQVEGEELRQLAARVAREQLGDSEAADKEVGYVPDSSGDITELPAEAEAAGLTLEQWRNSQNLVESGQDNIFGAIQRVAGRDRASAYSRQVTATKKRKKTRGDIEAREDDPELPVFDSKEEEKAFHAEQVRLATEYNRVRGNMSLEEYLATQPDTQAINYFRIHSGVKPPDRYL